MKFRLSIPFVLAGMNLASGLAIGQELPRFVEQLIRRYEAGPETSSPGSIWQYEYDGTTVFHVPLSRNCCDRYSILYDRSGEVVCRPDGGFAGGGDGKCPEFIAQRQHGVEVRRDARTEKED
jgi:hypothetical protein